jgi:hypothetical protein
MFVSSMCQMSFLPFTQSSMGTGINFQPAPIFRTGVIHFCHPGQFLELYPSIFLHKQFFANCTIITIILFSYFIVFLLILLGMYSYTFYPQLFWGQFLRIVMLHFSNAAHFYNWTNAPLSSEPILELYPSIFLHTPIFVTVLFHLSF